MCLHNHPSGNPEPSREDIRITRQLAEAGGTMGIPVHDHLIIAGTKHTSLAERGVID
ncbi:JAB domain-containing protein [Salinibacter ruber]|uniref:JAB domain-containing protein n=1 Tax=Salinibacter ruber TaxID=146919 RepID=UPI0021693902